MTRAAWPRPGEGSFGSVRASSLTGREVFALSQVTLSCWFGLVVWGFAPLVLVEDRWETIPEDHQTTNPNHQLEGS